MFVGVDVSTPQPSAVLMDGPEVRAAVIRPPTPSRPGGVAAVLAELARDGIDEREVSGVTVCLSEFQDALEVVDGLSTTACIRMCATETESAPPLSGWPNDVRAALGEHVFTCSGGHEFDGTPTRPLDLDEIDRVAAELVARDISSVAITSVFSPINAETELAAAQALRHRLPSARLSLSHEMGQIGLFERENAAIINAALLAKAAETLARLVDEVASVLPRAQLYLALNDGTAMGVPLAEHYPIFTFWSGPATAMTGASALAGESDCVVVEIGNKATLVGAVSSGSPRRVRHRVSIAGVPTHLGRPEALTLPCGAGNGETGESSREAMTAAPAGTRRPHRVVTGTDTRSLTAQLDTAVRTVSHHDALPVVIAGPGAGVVPAQFEAIRPDHGDVVRAVGAARSGIGATVEYVISGDRAERQAAIDGATARAVQKAVMAGAADRTIEIVELEELPLAYLPGDYVRVRVKAVGRLTADDARRPVPLDTHSPQP